jgi:hypothetical protein
MDMDKNRIQRDFVGKWIRISYRADRVPVGSLNDIPA